ncbi:LytR family transcriptional attenuator [Deinococcus yavapaiensis KR-236]|uniref:LytR family transcriptional attenuator n=1 Tax=Deinococcus yavapaiensis KR-236 TaxID=694435 RepID=A0A318S557_9DEIO|nr:LytR family transcriptional attenuator [Deinococcus yavapaiensis KR-236]
MFANVILVVLLVLAGLTAWSAPAVPTLTKYAALPKAPETTRTFLVAGVSPRYVGYHQAAPEDYTGLTDTIMLVQLRANEPTIRMLNVPRDTWVELPERGMSKINAASNFGPDELVNAVRNLTGVSVDGYVLLSLNALREVTDAAGGVTVDVKEPMKYTDTAAKLYIDFQPGRQHLDGRQAEAYLRFRYDRLGDIGRVGRQQEFVGALQRQLLSPLGLLHVPNVVAALGSNVRTSLSREDVAEVFGALLRRPTLEPHLLPGHFGGMVWIPEDDKIQTLVHDKFALEAVAGDPRALKIAIVNVSAPAGSARRLQEKLQGLGYVNVTIGNGDGDRNRTTLLTTDKKAAERLRDDLGYGRIVLGGVGEAGADLTIRLAADFPQSQN